MSKSLATSALLLGICVLSACSRGGDEATTDVTAAPPPPPAQPAVESMRFGREIRPDGTVVQATDEFAPGQPVQVAIDLEGTAPGTAVTVHWYGPEGQPLAYETKTLAGSEDRLSFSHESTQDWNPGTYRAEVWVADRKLQDQSFEITAGNERAASADQSS